MSLEVVQLTEEDFQGLKTGGFFRLILDHPFFEVYWSSGNTLTIHLARGAAVQIGEKR